MIIHYLLFASPNFLEIIIAFSNLLVNIIFEMGSSSFSRNDSMLANV